MTVEQLILLRFALAHIDPTHPKPHPSSYLNGTFPVETKGAESSVDADNVEFLVDTFQSFSRSLLEQESHLLKEAHHFTGSKGVATPPTTFSTTGDDPYVGVGVAWSALPLDFITVSYNERKRGEGRQERGEGRRERWVEGKEGREGGEGGEGRDGRESIIRWSYLSHAHYS